METAIPKEVVVPITSSWWKMKCTLEEEDGKYIFRFHEPRKEYQPGDNTLIEALNLKLDEEKPSPEVVKFINDFGTLFPYAEYEALAWERSAAQSVLSDIRSQMAHPVEGRDEKEREMIMTHLRRQEADAKARLEMLEYGLAGGPYERWENIYRSILGLQHIYLAWRATGDVQGLARYVKNLEPRLVKHGAEVVWEFGFSSLFDDLVGRLALSIVQGRSWKTCPNCREEFINGKRRFCGPSCREAYHNKRKSDDVSKEQFRLYQTLRRRREKDLIDDETFERVGKQLNRATSVPALKAVEKKNSEIYARLKPGPTLNGGPRQHRD